jgi:hypothetical protein
VRDLLCLTSIVMIYCLRNWRYLLIIMTNAEPGFPHRQIASFSGCGMSEVGFRDKSCRMTTFYAGWFSPRCEAAAERTDDLQRAEPKHGLLSQTGGALRNSIL